MPPKTKPILAKQILFLETEYKSIKTWILDAYADANPDKELKKLDANYEKAKDKIRKALSEFYSTLYKEGW